MLKLTNVLKEFIFDCEVKNYSPSVNDECDEKTCICNVGGKQKYFRID